MTIGFAIYFNAFDNPFEYDDEMYIEKNPNIRDTGNIPKFFVTPRLSVNDPRNVGHYRPLVVTSYAINYALGGLDPVGFHLFNLSFHVGTAFLLFLIVHSLLKGGWGGTRFFTAFAAGLIFLVHPFNSEVVNYSTARSSVMSGFFYLLGFYCWIRFREVTATGDAAGFSLRNQNSRVHTLKIAAVLFYMVSLLAFMLGMLSKEVVITLPVVLLFYDLYDKGWFHWRRYMAYLPFVLMVLIPYLLMRRSSFGHVLPYFRRSIIAQIYTGLPVLVKHWQMFIWPTGFSLVHDINIYNALSMPVFFSLTLITLCIAGAFYLLRTKSIQWRIVSFFMFWFFIVLLPTTIIPLNAIFQENRGYLAVVSFAVVTGILFGELFRKRSRIVAVGLIILLSLTWSLVTVYRNFVWGDEIRLWKDVVEKAPNSGAGYAALSSYYRDRGDLYLSVETARKGIAIAPNHFFIRNNLGRTYSLMGETDLAIQEYEEALKIDPRQSLVWNELALLYAKKGDLGLSEGFLKRAINIWKDLPPLYYNLGIVLAGQGKFAEAIETYRKATTIYPEYIQARYEMADALARLDRHDEARKEYQEIVRLGSSETGSRSVMFAQDKAAIEKLIEESRQRLNR